jgi:hypothetical protein
MSLPSREPWLSVGEAQHRLADSSRDSTAESVPMSDGSTTVPGSNALGGGASKNAPPPQTVGDSSPPRDALVASVPSGSHLTRSTGHWARMPTL